MGVSTEGGARPRWWGRGGGGWRERGGFAGGRPGWREAALGGGGAALGAAVRLEGEGRETALAEGDGSREGGGGPRLGMLRLEGG